MNFTKTFFATLLAFIVGSILMGIFAIMILVTTLVAIGNASQGIPARIKPNSVLMIDLKGGISDAPITSPFLTDGLGNIRINNSVSILQVVAAIESAAEDDNIKGAYINTAYRGRVSMSNMEELRNALHKFRKSGKFVVSYADSYSQINYYLASVADRVYLNPQGDIDWRGLASGVMFYKGLLDKLDIHAEILRHGTFKSAVEPFMLDRMSPASREQMNVMLNDMWGAMLSEISGSRGIESNVLSAYASDLTIDSPEMAYDCGMIDGILYEDQVIDMLGRLAAGYETIGSDEIIDEDGEEWVEVFNSGRPAGTQGEYAEKEEPADTPDDAGSTDGDEENMEDIDDLGDYEDAGFDVAGSGSPKPNLISISDYIKGFKSYSTAKPPKHRVAVVYVDGDIIDGESRGGSVGGKTIAAKLDKAREDKNVKAVVLRVNSPGGSALASEVIWRAVDMVRQEKPVIVSMGSMAASGGYYVSCPGDLILAGRTTLTGSIGVFGIMFDVSDALSNNLGITFDIAKTNPSADLSSGFRRISPYERRFMMKQVENTYSAFVGHVADGRNMSVGAVDAIGGGRVWSGVSATRNGLVDGFGGLLDAIGLAAERAGLGNNYHVWEVIDSPDNLSVIMRSLLSSEGLRMRLTDGDPVMKSYKEIRNIIESGNSVQARMPYDVDIW